VRGSPEYTTSLKQKLALAEERARQLYEDIIDRDVTFPVKSPLDNHIYNNAADYARHLAAKNVMFAPDKLPETPPGELRDPPTRGYFRYFGPDKPEAQAVFYYENPLNDSFSSTGGVSEIRNPDGRLAPVGRVKIYVRDSPNVLIKNIDEDAKKRWPHQYAAFQAATAAKL
jgi:hypothetical protein